MNENETNAAPIVPPTSASGCSKYESATPLTDALFAKCKSRQTEGSGSRDGGWGQQDIADFLRHSRKLEIALGITTAALEKVLSYGSQLQAYQMHVAARGALEEIQTLNPKVEHRPTGQ